MRWVRTALLIVSILASPSARSAAEEAPCHAPHLALVIGNSAYSDSDAPLREPVGDARELADALQRLGFATTEAENLTRDHMRSIIDEFEQRITNDAVALVFFSGYGIQSGGHTYLIPVDGVIWNEQDIKTVGFNLDRILSDLADRGARLRLVIVDGARHNPYERRFRPTGSLGMAAVNGTPGVLALYSSLPGTSFDESGGNTSPFVDALITALRKPGAEAEEAFRRARADAARVYKGSQTPWVSSFLDEDIPLDGGSCRAPAAGTAEAVPAPSRPSAAASPAQPSPAPKPTVQGTSQTQPVVAAQVPARPISTVVAPSTTSAAPSPAVPQTTAPLPQPAAPQPGQSPDVKRAPASSADQTAMPSTPPAPAPAAPDVSKPQPTASVAPPAPPAPAVDATRLSPPPVPPPHVPEQVAAQPPPQPLPAPNLPPQAEPTAAPRQNVAMSVSPPPRVTEDADGNEQITDPVRLKEINDRLYDRGYDPGPPGSAETRSATLQYEREAALPLGEQPTTRLLTSLRTTPVPTPWAAITISKDRARSSYGMSWGEDSRRAALADAKSHCGPDECIEAESFLGHQCGAFARSPTGWSITARDDAAQARAAALAICEHSGPNCNIVSAVCADGSDKISAAGTQASSGKPVSAISTARVPFTSQAGHQPPRKPLHR